MALHAAVQVHAVRNRQLNLFHCTIAFPQLLSGELRTTAAANLSDRRQSVRASIGCSKPVGGPRFASPVVRLLYRAEFSRNSSDTIPRSAGLVSPQEEDMTRIWFRSTLFALLGALVLVCLCDNSADAGHRRRARHGCRGCWGGGCGGGCNGYSNGYAYRGVYGQPVAPYGDRAFGGPGVYGGAGYGVPAGRSARGAIEGRAGARVDGSLGSPSDRARIRAGAEAEGRADVNGQGAGVRTRANGESDAPPPPPAEPNDGSSELPPPRSPASDESAPPPAEPDSP